jgi:hypothetical protein
MTIVEMASVSKMSSSMSPSLQWISCDDSLKRYSLRTRVEDDSITLESLTQELDFFRSAGRETQKRYDAALEYEHRKLQGLRQKYYQIWNHHGRRTSVSPYLNTLRKISQMDNSVEKGSQHSHIPYVQNWESQVCQANHRLGILKRQRNLMNYQAKREVECMTRIATELREELEYLRQRLNIQADEIQREHLALISNRQAIIEYQNKIRSELRTYEANELEEEKPKIFLVDRTWFVLKLLMTK